MVSAIGSAYPPDHAVSNWSGLREARAIARARPYCSSVPIDVAPIWSRLLCAAASQRTAWASLCGAKRRPPVQTVLEPCPSHRQWPWQAPRPPRNSDRLPRHHGVRGPTVPTR